MVTILAMTMTVRVVDYEDDNYGSEGCGGDVGGGGQWRW